MLDIVIAVLLVFSFILVVKEVDCHGDVPSWIKVAEGIMCTMYAVEMLARLYVLRGPFFCRVLNVADLAIVTTDAISLVIHAMAEESLPSLAVLRVFRLLRLTRSLKVIVMFPQLALMIKGLMNAASAVGYGLVLLSLVITVWSIGAVQLIHPVNERISLTGAYDDCPRCKHAFESVGQSALTFVQQILMGDSWGLVTLPIIEEAPLSAVFFAAVFVSVHLALVNVILAVIVESAMKASQEDAYELARSRAEKFRTLAAKLTTFCVQLDRDGSGDLSEQELIDGLNENPAFADELLAIGILKEDMHIVFSILDTDDSGTVAYNEFVTEIFKMKEHHSHTLLLFIKHHVTQIQRDFRHQMHGLRRDIMGKLGDMHQSSGSGTLLAEPPEDKVQPAAGIRGPEVSTARSRGGGVAPERKPGGTRPRDVEEKAQPVDLQTRGFGSLQARALLAGEAPEGEGRGCALAGKADAAGRFEEDLLQLRSVIIEDLLRSMKDMAARCEAHVDQLATIAGAEPPQRHCGGAAAAS